MKKINWFFSALVSKRVKLLNSGFRDWTSDVSLTYESDAPRHGDKVDDVLLEELLQLVGASLQQDVGEKEKRDGE